MEVSGRMGEPGSLVPGGQFPEPKLLLGPNKQPARWVRRMDVIIQMRASGQVDTDQAPCVGSVPQMDRHLRFCIICAAAEQGSVSGTAKQVKLS